MSIDIKELTLLYSKNKILDHISCTFKEGQVNLLLGPSGSGKSSLMYILKGLIPHAIEGEITGDVLKDDVSIKGLEPCVLAPEIGLIFQDPDTQFATFTVEDELLFGMENLKFSHDEMTDNMDKYLKLLKIEHLRHRSLNTLSGGEKQRVAIASVLTLEPEVIIFDEPTSNLDVRYRKMIFSLIKTLKEDFKKTIIIIEHSLEFLIEVVDCIVVLNNRGSILVEGNRHDVLSYFLKERNSEGIYLPKGIELLRYHNIEALEKIPLSRNEVVEFIKNQPIMLSNKFKEPFKGSINEVPFLEVSNLGYQIKDKVILKDISFTINKGDFIAILGPNGAGKSTLSHVMLHLYKHYEGLVKLDGKPIKKYKKKDFFHKAGLVFQNPEWQFVSYTVEDELYYSLKKFNLSTEDKEAKVTAFLKQFNLIDERKNNPYQLSQGQKRRLSVAAMLIAGQELLVLDEPTFGQDEENQKELLDYMKSINEEQGVTVVVITHDMDLVGKYCNRALVLKKGEKAFDGTVVDLFKNDSLLNECHLDKPYWQVIAEHTSHDIEKTFSTLEDLYEHLKEGNLYGIH